MNNVGRAIPHSYYCFTFYRIRYTFSSSYYASFYGLGSWASRMLVDGAPSLHLELHAHVAFLHIGDIYIIAVLDLKQVHQIVDDCLEYRVPSPQDS
eukprot:6473927-Amphidinium_carterae.1